MQPPVAVGALARPGVVVQREVAPHVRAPHAADVEAGDLPVPRRAPPRRRRPPAAPPPQVADVLQGRVDQQRLAPVVVDDELLGEQLLRRRQVVAGEPRQPQPRHVRQRAPQHVAAVAAVPLQARGVALPPRAVAASRSA